MARPPSVRAGLALVPISAIAILLVAAPGVMGLTYVAPYAHVQQVPFDWMKATTGCATQQSTTPTFNFATGNATWKGKVAVGACAGKFRKALTDNIADASGATELSIPVKAPFGVATRTTFNVTWNITATGNYAMTRTSPCIDPLPANSTGSYECLALALASLMGDAWLVDLTNGSVTMASSNPIVSGAGTEILNYTLCSPSCISYVFVYPLGTPFSGLQSDSFIINATMNHADKYAIVTYVGGFAAAQLSGFTGHASAYVNMGTGGNGAQLVSIVET